MPVSPTSQLYYTIFRPASRPDTIMSIPKRTGQFRPETEDRPPNAGCNSPVTYASGSGMPMADRPNTLWYGRSRGCVNRIVQPFAGPQWGTGTRFHEDERSARPFVDLGVCRTEVAKIMSLSPSTLYKFMATRGLKLARKRVFQHESG